MREKVRSLPTLAAAVALLAAIAGGVASALPSAPAGSSASSGTGRSVGASTARPGDGPVPLLDEAQLTSASVPAVPVGYGPAATVAPLRQLRQADMIVVAPSSLPRRTLATIRRLPDVTAAESVEAAKVQVNGRYVAVLGVDPGTFRDYAARSTAAASGLWRNVADGAVVVSYTMGWLDRLPLGGVVHVTGTRRENLRVGGFGTVGIAGVDAVVSHAVARSLGMPAGNAIVVSAPHANLADLASAIKRVIPHGTAVEPLMTQVTAGVTAGQAAAADAGVPAGSTGGAAGVSDTEATALSSAQVLAMLTAARSRVGMPYVWGGSGPTTFDCSGLVQWSFAQAGIRMPRVAADQARTGPAVPLSQLQPGDLLFYHTDPTAPGYISHVGIYLGNGLMIQAPEPGMKVEVIPVWTGPEFAGAVRVDPALAAAVAGSI